MARHAAWAPSYFPATLVPSARSGDPCRPPGTVTASSRALPAPARGRRASAMRLQDGRAGVLDEIDNDLEAGPQGWTFRHPAAQQFFLFVEVAFTTLPMAIATAVAAALLFWRKHGRAALWTVGVMLGASLTNYLLKGVPAAQASGLGGPGHHADPGLSFPSGHFDRDRRRGRGW